MPFRLRKPELSNGAPNGYASNDCHDSSCGLLSSSARAECLLSAMMRGVIGFPKRVLSRTPGTIVPWGLLPMSRLFSGDPLSCDLDQEHRAGSLKSAPIFLMALVFLVLPSFSGQAVAAEHGWPVRVLKHLMAPFRSRPFLQSKASPCEIGIASCFSPNSSLPPLRPVEPEFEAEDSSGPVMLELRTKHGGPFAHHWLELESSAGRLTVGFGPATLPFIDAGQVSLQDRYGNVKRISGMHPLPWLTLPPINYHYAKAPGEGHIIGEPIPLTKVEAESLAQKMQHIKFVGPYIPIFHDCRTFACKVQATAQHRSTLPCYLLFKGYW